MRSKEIECRLTLQAPSRIRKVSSEQTNSRLDKFPAEAAGVTERLRLLAIRLAETELLRRGFLPGDLRRVPMNRVTMSFARNADITDHAQLAVRSDDALRHIATNSDGDHSIQCLLHHCPIVGMHDLSVV
jgi:hypothetical protein